MWGPFWGRARSSLGKHLTDYAGARVRKLLKLAVRRGENLVSPLGGHKPSMVNGTRNHPSCLSRFVSAKTNDLASAARPEIKLTIHLEELDMLNERI